MYRLASLSIVVLILCVAAAADPPQLFGPPFPLQPQSTLGPVPGGQNNYDIAAGNGQFTEVWSDYRIADYYYETDQWFQHFVVFYGQTNTDGTLPNPVGVEIGAAGGQVGLAWNGQNYLSVMQLGSQIRACRISTGGEMLDGYAGFSVSVGQNPSVTSDGTDWYAVWEAEGTGGWRIYGAKVSASGQTGTPSRLCSVENRQQHPTVTWSGGCYVVVFEDGRADGSDLYALRVAQDGTVLDPAGFAVCAAAGEQTLPSAASLGAGTSLVAWQDKRDASYSWDVFAARVNDKGNVLDPNGSAVCHQANEQMYVDAAAFAGNYVVVWEDRRSTSPQAYMARIDADGAVLDPNGAQVYSSASRWQQTPRVSGDASTCLIAWLDGASEYDEQLVGRRFDTHFTALDAQPILLTKAGPYQRSVALVKTPSGFMAAFEELPPGPYEPDLYVAPLDNDGVITTAGQKLVAGGTSMQALPALAFDGTNCLVAWTTRNGAPANDDLFAARVDQQGNVLDDPPVSLCDAAGMQIDVRLAYGGGTYLAVWMDERSGPRHIHGARVDPNGIVVDNDGFLICQCDQNHAAAVPSVVWDGSRFLVVWYEFWPYHDYAIKGRFIDPADPAGSPAAFAVASTVHPEWVADPTVARGDDGFLVAYTYLPSDPEQPISSTCARRLAPDGTVLDANQLVVCHNGDSDKPVAVWDGSSYVVVWSTYSLFANSLSFCRVLENGTVVERQGVAMEEIVSDIGGRDKAVVPRGDGKLLTAWRQYACEPPFGIARIYEKWITLPVIMDSIASARTTPDDTLITITGKPVTAGSEDFDCKIYIEEPTRASGIPAYWSRSAVPRGASAAVSGLVKTVNGERVIEAQAVAAWATGQDELDPLGLANWAIGGSSPNASLIPQIPGAFGTYNTGLLVRVWGRVTAAGSDWFYVDDGAKLGDGSGHDGVKVTVAGLAGNPGINLPDEGDYVAVTGLSSCEIPEGETDPIRLIRPRRASDISDPWEP